MKVVVGTPSLTGQVQVEYVESLVETVRLASKHDVDVYPILLSYESILPQARNEIVKIAYGAEADMVVFIDADISWSPTAFLKVVQAEQDVVAITYPRKSDEPRFECNFDLNNPELNGDLLKVDSVGTGFMKLSKTVLTGLWENSQDILFRGKLLKNVFEYATPKPNTDDDALVFMSEDIHLCAKIRALGFDIWVDTTTTCGHHGTKCWHYSFADFLKVVQQNTSIE